ncbi:MULTISPECIES: ABC transporter ATP-binding protein [Dehalococcoides]|jgi:branched-chain amino acid transport system ATP-binding protein|uniref:Branched-chain amino acid transport ATP-binding protein LivF n=3 Tax=Dehalococcoides mccartyi TaxID=61435 RepID=A0A142V9V7_9CHLR|nr:MULTISPECIES: ABC transporter ATP-binding protein [Dehalococcoides]AGG06486.1 hydrophobic amino acid uptake transporter (HAAT) family, ATP-binding protein [Dehalococcoides mccartyi DCMB5]AII60996.1 branched-chain amino acid ABC transporter ATP-binding protein [Dehalococcoides mccartyi CG5]AMU86620.1 branched-chain amino acid transport system ATP-binding protein [Dehalococcoides mccartyi]AOV99444.1 branched-chain amino acid transport ATP-binding protein LivF [Dehalococcoides mccartyi]AQU0592
MLKVNNIEVTYLNVIKVLHGVSLEVPEKSIVALLGGNGAGKTTTLKAISGLLHTEEGLVTDGNIEWDGTRIEKKNPEAIGKLGIVQALEGRHVFEHLTTEENLIVGAFNRKDRQNIKPDLSMVYEYFPRLKHVQHNTAGYLSGGEQQMLVIGRAMMARPKLMMLDEPSLGLAPLMVKEIFGIIKRFNEEQGTSVLLVEQNVKVALSIAHYGYVLENGRIVLDGDTSFLTNNEDVKEFYMGLSTVGAKKSYREVKHYKRRKRWL